MRSLFRAKLGPFVIVAAVALIGGTAAALAAHAGSDQPAVAPAQGAGHAARTAKVRPAAAAVKKAKAVHVASQSDPTAADEQDNEVEGQDDNEVEQPDANDDDQREVEQDDQGDNNDDQGENDGGGGDD
jgi:hypothetical protein